MPQSKFFRVLTEGDTTDGRIVQRSWIEQAAKNFNRAKYGARVWLEHFRSLLPESPFRAYGDVLAVKAEEVDLGDGVKKLALFAQIDATADLVAMNKARQKIYTSAEIDPNFARSGEAYLTGLAVTDSPASLGTEILAFCAGAKTNPLAARKEGRDVLFSEAHEVALEFEDEKPEAGENLFSKVKALLTGKDKKDAAVAGDHAQAIEAIALSQKDVLDQSAALKAGMEKLTEQYAALVKTTDTDRQAFAALKADLDKTPDGHNRPPATGGDGKHVTDC